jgi:hypothetical protein
MEFCASKSIFAAYPSVYAVLDNGGRARQRLHHSDPAQKILDRAPNLSARGIVPFAVAIMPLSETMA